MTAPSRHVASAILLATACTRAAPAGSTAPREPPPTDVRGVAGDEAGVSAPPTVAQAPTVAPAAEPTPPPDAGKADVPWLDVQAWLAEHGVPPGGDGDNLSGCKAVRVGAPLRDALLCDHDGSSVASEPGGEMAFAVRIFVVERAQLRVVFRAAIAAGPLDKEQRPSPDDPNDGDYVRLAAEVSRDGLRVTLRDHPGAGCAERLRELRAQNAGDTELRGVLTPHIHMMEVACRARGTYVWKSGAFVRAAR
jgi:hypothetical protein